MFNFKIVTASQANLICKHKNSKNVNNVMAMLTFSLASNVSKKKKKLTLNCINIKIPNTSPAVKYASKNKRNIKTMKHNSKIKKRNLVLENTISYIFLCSWFRASQVYINKCPTRCNNMQSVLFYCKITLHVSGVFHTHHQEYIKL